MILNHPWVRAGALYAGAVGGLALLGKPALLAAPWIAAVVGVAAILGTALIVPAPAFPRRVLVTAAVVLGAGVAGAAWMAYTAANGRACVSAALQHSGTAWIALSIIATTPPAGGRWCRSGTLLIASACLVAAAMVASEAL